MANDKAITTQDAVNTIAKNNALCGITNGLLAHAKERQQNYEIIECEGKAEEAMRDRYELSWSCGVSELFNKMTLNAACEYLRRPENRESFDECLLSHDTEGYNVKAYHQGTKYKVVFKTFHQIEADEVRIVVLMLDEDDEVAFWTSLRVMNVDRYVKNIDGYFYLGNDCAVTILPAEYYGEEEDDDY